MIFYPLWFVHDRQLQSFPLTTISSIFWFIFTILQLYQNCNRILTKKFHCPVIIAQLFLNKMVYFRGSLKMTFYHRSTFFYGDGFIHTQTWILTWFFRLVFRCSLRLLRGKFDLSVTRKPLLSRICYFAKFQKGNFEGR